MTDKPTMHFRWLQPYSYDAEAGEVVIHRENAPILQQLWETEKDYEVVEEWRTVPTVVRSA